MRRPVTQKMLEQNRAIHSRIAQEKREKRKKKRKEGLWRRRLFWLFLLDELTDKR